MRLVSVMTLVLTVLSQEEEECSKFCPEELRATVFDSLMMKKIKFIRTTLDAAIDGLEELEQKTKDVPESMKEKLGLNVEDDDNDTTEEMRVFLVEQLDSVLSGDMRAWDRITDTYQDILQPSRAPKAPKSLTDLRAELSGLVTSLQWSSEALQPLLSTLGSRLARIFTTLVRMMETMMKFGGEEVTEICFLCISDHFDDEWKMLLVLTPPTGMEFSFILYFSTLMASLSQQIFC